MNDAHRTSLVAAALVSMSVSAGCLAPEGVDTGNGAAPRGEPRSDVVECLIPPCVCLTPPCDDPCGPPVVDGAFTPLQLPGCLEYPDEPMVGLYTDFYARFRDGRLYLLNDWHYRDDKPVPGGCYNLFEVMANGGAQKWGIRVYGNQTIEVTLDGLPFEGNREGATGFGPSQRHPFDHAIFEFAVPVAPGTVQIGACDPAPGPGQVVDVATGETVCEMALEPHRIAGELSVEGTAVLSLAPIPPTEPVPMELVPSYGPPGTKVLIVGYQFGAAPGMVSFGTELLVPELLVPESWTDREVGFWVPDGADPKKPHEVGLVVPPGASGGGGSSRTLRFGESTCQVLPDGTPCNDGEPCTTGDVCHQGACVGVASTVCPDAGPCQPGSCAPGVGCTTKLLDEGEVCKAACFGLAHCDSAGTCVPDPETETICLPEPGSCVESMVCKNDACVFGVYHPVGTPCDADQDPCTIDKCDQQHACVATWEDPCEGQKLAGQCKIWLCEAETGACHMKGVAPHGTPCTDGDPCTQMDACDSLALACLGQPIQVDDGDPCTVDTCDDGIVAHTLVDGLICPGDACDPLGICEAGVCQFNACGCQAELACPGSQVLVTADLDDGTLELLALADTDPTDAVSWFPSNITAVSPPWSVHLGHATCPNPGTGAGYYSGPVNADCTPVDPLQLGPSTGLDVRLDLPEITLGAGQSAFVGFWVRMSAEAAYIDPVLGQIDFDWLEVRATAGGSTKVIWRSTAAYALGPDNTTAGQWSYQVADLAAFQGQSVVLSFRFAADADGNWGVLGGGPYEGVYLDDILVRTTCAGEACQPGSLCAEDCDGCKSATCSPYPSGGGVCAGQAASPGATCKGCVTATDCGTDACFDYTCKADYTCDIQPNASCPP